MRSENEAREKGKRGGVASGESRREMASLRAAAEMLLARKVPPGEMETALEEMGVKKSERSLAMATVAGMIRRAIDGNPAAFTALMKLMGEGVERQEIDVNGSMNVSNVDGILAGWSDEDLRQLITATDSTEG